eukprot:TRINITY_DN49628_c0_g1_i1.p2 TRINITY_DN49628_c0_g1~~TRINITY_DN49628_c0_g1_i1.p2  ORF type:complete len:384 (-),score=84.62 TRINITY_DN49628_c0_g1_i1:204-1298(-)
MASRIRWWLQRLRKEGELELEAWSQDPEWPLLHVGLAFFGSFLLHWLGYRLAVHRVGWPSPWFAETEWEGRVGWRKPLVFGLSNAMVFCSLRRALRAQRLCSRARWAHLAAWATAVEVGVITLQAWRGVPSHFNTATDLDAVLYAVKLGGALLLSATCVAAAVGVLLRPARGLVADLELVALRHGLLLVLVSIAVGLAQVVYGHSSRAARAEEAEPCLAATNGVESSPCYEIHGQAIVKLAHFLPLHATEVLLMLAWAAKTSGSSQGRGLLRVAALGCWSIALLGLWSTWRGVSLKAPTADVGFLALVSLAPIPAAFLMVFFSAAVAQQHHSVGCNDPCAATANGAPDDVASATLRTAARLKGA